ncbi:MAG TPA: diguanylate cyclase [Anaerolineaceae bacterium]|nr:diguanylate cyclase [Anaerolineaceae bacterium]
MNPLTVVISFTTLLCVVQVLVMLVKVPTDLYFLPTIPLLLIPLYYDRRFYIPLLLLLVLGVIWANLSPAGLRPEIAVSVSIAAFCMLVIMEITHSVAQKLEDDEARSRENERKYRRFFENSEDGFFMVNENGQICEWNSSMEQLTGLNRASANGKPAWEILYRLVPEDRKSRALYDALKSNFQEMLQKGQVPSPLQTGEQQIQSLDGTLRTIRQNTFLIESERGWLIGLGMRDVTDTHAEDVELRKTNDLLTEAVKEMERRNKEAGLLNEMGDLLQSCLAVSDTYAVFGQFAEQIFPDQSGILYLLDNDHNLYESVASWGGPLASDTTFAPDACWTLRRGRVHIVTDPGNRLVCPHLRQGKQNQGFAPYLCVPMTVQGETLGVLHIQTNEQTSIEQLEQLAVTVAVRVGLAVANLKLRETLRVQSIRDPLTGMFNRRYMEETLERELHRAARHQLPLGVIMLDIDHFKQFNDTYGHEAGDGLLRELATFLQANVRSEDVPCRYGGEEFIIILPEASLEDTCRRAEQLQEGIHHLKLQYPEMPLGMVTVSQGVAGFPDHGASAGQLLRTVDAALYRAKRSGRDRVIVAEK